MTKTYTGVEGVREQPDNLLWIGLIIARNLRQASVTISTSATLIPTTPLSKRRVLQIINISSNVVYIGNSSVTSSDGFPLYPRAVIQFSIEDSIDVYGISSSPSEIRILEGA